MSCLKYKTKFWKPWLQLSVKILLINADVLTLGSTWRVKICRPQCYDGTFVMAGVRSGVQALMQHCVRIRFVRKRYLFSGSVKLIYVKSEIKTDKVFLQSNAYKIAAMALTNGVSFATCEASFSTCSRILISFRLSVSKNRMRDLVLLPFEPKVLLNMLDEDLLKGFKAVKNHPVIGDEFRYGEICHPLQFCPAPPAMLPTLRG
ncbi:Cysteine desulfurase [Trichinella pseudospiralis]